MLVNFRVNNFKSYKADATFTFLADAIKEYEETHIFPHSGIRLLHSAALFGANAGGKSNLVSALATLRKLVLRSAKESQSGDKLPMDSFRLSTETEGKPSELEIEFFLGERYVQYGFAADKDHIVKEWLRVRKRASTKPASYFERHEQHFNIGSFFKEGEKLTGLTRPNALFISVSAQFNSKIAMDIVQWFRDLKILSGYDDSYRGFTLHHVSENKVIRSRVEKLLKIADIGIEGVDVEKEMITKDNVPDSMPDWFKNEIVKEKTVLNAFNARTFHKRFDDTKTFVDRIEFDLDKDESKGTQKLFNLAGPLLNSLDLGNILVIDELDARLHPRLVIEIIKMFHSPQTNPNHAQLLFTTHNTRLLAEDLFRRDQVWFAEKNRYGESELYSLLDIDEPKIKRKDASFEKNYLLGKYGAVPGITGFEHIGCEEQDES